MINKNFFILASLAISFSCKNVTKNKYKNNLIEIGEFNKEPNLGLISKDNKVNPKLVDFIKFDNVLYLENAHEITERDEDIKKINFESIESINSYMQKWFIRKPGLERRDLVDSDIYLKNKDEYINKIKALGVLEEISPSEINPDYFLIFGAFSLRMQYRLLDFIKNSENIIPKKLVFIGASNRLIKDFEEEFLNENVDVKIINDFLVSSKKTIKELSEADIQEILWNSLATDKLKLNYNKSKENLIFIGSSNNAEGSNNRATTHGSLKTFLEEEDSNTKNKKDLICYMNVETPYSKRMREVLLFQLLELNKKFEGRWKSIYYHTPFIGNYEKIVIYKDEIARMFYQELSFKKTFYS